MNPTQNTRRFLPTFNTPSNLVTALQIPLIVNLSLDSGTKTKPLPMNPTHTKNPFSGTPPTHSTIHSPIRATVIDAQFHSTSTSGIL